MIHDCVQCESALVCCRAEEPRTLWLYRVCRLVVEYPQYTTSNMCHILRDGGRRIPATMFTTPRLLQCQQQTYRLRIAISAYLTCIRHPRLNIAIPFGVEKLEWCGCPTVKNFLKISLFDLTQLTNVTDTQTDTAWWHRPRLCIASRGKNLFRTSLVAVGVVVVSK